MTLIIWYHQFLAVSSYEQAGAVNTSFNFGGAASLTEACFRSKAATKVSTVGGVVGSIIP